MTNEELRKKLEELGADLPGFNAGYLLGMMDGFRKAREIIIKSMEEENER